LRLSFAIFAVKSFNRKGRKGFAQGAKKTAGDAKPHHYQMPPPFPKTEQSI
jgi:hypothetical protein